MKPSRKPAQTQIIPAKQQAASTGVTKKGTNPVANESKDHTQPSATIDDVTRLAQITEELTRTMEKTRIAEYVQYLDHPFRLLWTNFLIGIARGLGSTIGLAVVLGLFVYFVQKLIMLNLPGISDFIADFIVMIQDNYNMIK